MKISLNWIKQFTTVELTRDELIERIGRQLGEIEEVVDLGEKYKGVLIAEVQKVEEHPDADKLSICHIDDGRANKEVTRLESGLVQVVCGAPNVTEGMKVAWLPPRSTVPETFGTSDPFVLESRELRGVASNGMIASAKELGLGSDHSGILEVDLPAKNGAAFADVYEYTGDLIIDIENKMFTHRPDCFGVLGIARELAGIQNIQFTSPDWYEQEVEFKDATGLPLHVRNKIPELAPRFMAVAMSNIEVKASPVIMRSYLSRVGLKPVNNIVDITNFVMYVTAQPLHAFDYDKVAELSEEEGAVIEVRKPSGAEQFDLLNGKTIKPQAGDILIATPKKPIGLGGIMGGSDTEVGDSTKNVILECANFDMYNIRRTSMNHGLFTDAVTRFTKAQSPLQNEAALSQAISLVEDLSGGTTASPVIDSHSELPKLSKVEVHAEFINERLGLELDATDIAVRLANVEFNVEVAGEVLHVTAPFWRSDIAIAEDLVEEVGRLYGYDNLPLALLNRSIEPAARSSQLAFKSKLRNLLSAAGANEVLTYSFVDEQLLAAVGQDPEQAYKITNALSPELQYYRLTLSPSLLAHVHSNIKAGFDAFALFELNKTHIKKHQDEIEKGLPREINALAAVYANRSDSSPVAYYSARAYLDYLARQLGIEFEYQPFKKDPKYQSTAPFNLERSAMVHIRSGKKLTPIGIVGEYRNTVIKKLKLPKRCAGFEISLDDLREAVKSSVDYRQLSRFPSVEQDISLRVGEDLPYGELAATVQKAVESNKPDNSYFTLEPLDIYKPKKGDYKQVAFRLNITSYDRTLQAEEVNELLDQAAESAAKSHQAQRV